MLRFILVFCSLYCLVICDKTPEDHVFTKTVKEIISGERKGQDIPEDLRIVSQFYENPKPELFTKQEISLTCLGRNFFFFLMSKIHFNVYSYCNYSFRNFKNYLLYCIHSNIRFHAIPISNLRFHEF